MEVLIVMAIVLVVAMVAIIIAVGATNANSHEKRIARMHEKQKESLQQIDKTGEYYRGLYRYIARRLDDESRRRESR
ncbi:MAG: hypothetical protein ACYC0V_21340 [Armatimonadota bacterium]